MTSLLAVNGFIHSVSDPYATAMLIDNGVVAWMGADDTAEKVAAAQAPDARMVDLDGALVAPAFINSFSARTDPSRTSAHGEVLSTVVDPTTSAESIAPYRGAATALEAPVELGDDVGICVDLQDDSEQLTEMLGLSRQHRAQLMARSHDADQLAPLIAALSDQPSGTGLPTSHRLVLNHRIDDSDLIEQIAALRLSVTVVPEHSSDHSATVHAPIASLLGAGVPVALGSGAADANLWAGIRAMLHHPDQDQQVSARAGFTAATRTGARVLPAQWAQPWMESGRIAPGAPAHLNVWRAEQLSVQAPDSRVSAWSTDARAGTPLLPVLDREGSLPELVAHLNNGRTESGTL